MPRSIFIFCILVVTTAWGGAAFGADIAGYTPNSKEPWQLLVRLGPGPKAPEMLVVVDSSPGSTFYDKAVADTNLDGKLSGEKPPEPSCRSGLDIFNVTAPFGTVDAKAHYHLSINTRRDRQPRAGDSPIALVTEQVELRKDDRGFYDKIIGKDISAPSFYYIIVGKGTPDPTRPRVMRFPIGEPMRLETKSKVEGTTLSLSSTIKDSLGQILRLELMGGTNGKEIVPHLKLTAPSGKVLIDKGLSYG